MANDDKDEDLDLDVKSGSKSNTLLLIVLIVLLLLIGGGGGAYFLLNSDKGGSKPKAASEVVNGESAEEVIAEDFSHKPAIYFPLEPEFVVNLEDSSRVNFMQVELQVMMRNKEVVPIIEHHMPVIRNNIMLLLSSQKYAEISKREGKEKLMVDLKDSIQAVLNGEAPNMEIEAVYITSMVMQ